MNSITTKKAELARREWLDLLLDATPGLIVYAGLGFLLFSAFKYRIDNDSISYLSIAEKYFAYDFTNAINGYWGPLLSWLLLPLFSLGLNPIISIKLLCLITGAFAMVAAVRLTKIFELSKPQCVYYALTFSVPTVYYSLIANSPDVLMNGLILLYFSEIFSKNYNSTRTIGIKCGVIGGLCYLTKSYGFPFFLLHFTIFNIIHYLRSNTKEERKNVIVNSVAGIVLFIFIGGTWIYKISDKYETITIGTAAKYNYAFVGPESKGHPVFGDGLIVPPNGTAVSAWEDPSYIKQADWNPFISLFHFGHQVKVFLRNLYSAVELFQQFSIFTAAIIIVVTFNLKLDLNLLKNSQFYALLTCFLYISGYLLVALENRYLLPIYYLTAILGIKIIIKSSQSVLPSNRLKRWALLFILAASIICYPAKEIAKNAGSGQHVFHISNLLKSIIPSGEHIASNSLWGTSSFIAYLNGYLYFGKLAYKQDIFEHTEILNASITYYFEWIGAQFDNYNDYSLILCDNCIKIIKGNKPILIIHSLH